MAAPEGNEFWKLRSTHGRKKLFETPELLWEAACEYFEWCDKHPFIEKQLIAYQGEGSLTDVPKMRPYTLEGVCFYLNASSSYLRVFKSTLKESDKDFLTVINEIEEIIANQQFSGAASGFLNANIIARKLGLGEKTDLTSGGEKISNTLKVEFVNPPEKKE